MKNDDMQINNKFMQYIVALAQHQTITAAAESVFISQPAMSHFVHTLENRLGFKLFNRVGNRYIPTYEGTRYLYHARRIMLMESQMYSEFSEIKKTGRGQIRFALPTLRSEYILPRLISSYHRAHPNVDVIIRETHSRLLEKTLLAGDVDFAIMNGETKTPEIVTETISYEDVLLAVPPDHPCVGMGQRKEGSRYETIDLSLFQGEPFILQYPDQRTRQITDMIFGKAGFTPSVFMETHSIAAALGIVGSGVALCFAPELYVRNYHLTPQPRYFSLGMPETVYPISIAYLKNTYRPVYFLDFIQAAKAAIS